MAWAAPDVDANQASEAQLDSIRGIGPELSRRILAARTQRPFVDWTDLIRRVPGIGPASARKLSTQGLTVEGKPYSDAPKAVPQ